MAIYKVVIDKEALNDIQKATDWYNTKVSGLGSRFQKQVKIQITSLKRSPARYAIRYSMVRCMMEKKFPFLVHFTVNEAQAEVEVIAVYHTSRNPEIWVTTIN